MHQGQLSLPSLQGQVISSQCKLGYRGNGALQEKSGPPSTTAVGSGPTKQASTPPISDKTVRMSTAGLKTLRTLSINLHEKERQIKSEKMTMNM